MKYKKIHIIGSVGSGKTTLAKKLSKNFDIPHYELDNVVWKRFHSGDVRRSEKERDAFLKKIVTSDAWVNEGVHYQWVTESFVNAELIIFLDTRYSKRTYRIIKRFILQQLGFEKSNFKPTFSMFMRMFRWNSYFEKVSKREIIELLKEFDHKVIIIRRDNHELEKYLNQIDKRAIDVTNKEMAEMLLNLQIPAYMVEAKLINFYDIPPLKDTVETLQNCGEKFFGYFIENELCGAISYKVEGKTLDIHRLIVHPNHFRKGIATQLLSCIEEHVEEVDKIIVSTCTENKPAVELYLSKGYIIEKVVHVTELSLTFFVKRITR